jgi:hypothetical protein
MDRKAMRTSTLVYEARVLDLLAKPRKRAEIQTLAKIPSASLTDKTLKALREAGKIRTVMVGRVAWIELVLDKTE